MADQQKAPAQAGKKVTVYIAAAPFELDGQSYKAGDECVFPGWVRDLKYEEQRREAAIGADVHAGLSFIKVWPEVDKTTRERNVYRVILPVKEQ